MTSRQRKKKNKALRTKWIVNHLGTIERGYITDYFTIFPHDLKDAKRYLKSKGYDRALKSLLLDLKENYHNPHYERGKSEIMLCHLRYSDYLNYCPDKLSITWSMSGISLLKKAEFKV